MSLQQTGHSYLGDGRTGEGSRQLLKLAQDATPTGRVTLAHAVAQFFEKDEMNNDEHHLVIEIMMKLIHRTELDLRQALAERLAVLGNVPAEVIIFLANDDISVARPILERSPVLNDVDLIYIVSSKDARYWQSIAKREHLNPSVVRRLTETGDAGTAALLIGNTRLVLHRNALSKLIRISLKAEELQEPLLRRPEIDQDLAIELYACVSRAVRRDITKRYSISALAIETALDSLVAEMCDEAKGVLRVTPEMALLAKRFNERGEITPALLLKTLRRGQKSFFIALLAEQLGLVHEFVTHLLQQEAVKSFAVACRSIGMMKSEFASIYLLSRNQRVSKPAPDSPGLRPLDKKEIDQKELAEAIKCYDRLKDADVQRIRKEWSLHVEGV